MRKHIISLVVSVVIICGIAFNYDYFEELLTQISDAAMELVDDGTGAAVEELESELDDLKAEKFFIIEETESTQEETDEGGSSSNRSGSIKQVEYGSTDLSQEAIRYRQENNITGARNIAVYEYENNGQLSTIAGASQINQGHAERLIAKELENMGIQPAQVKRIYSELEPCSIPGGYCKRFLQTVFPQADVTYSFEYGLTQESRRAGVKALKEAVKKIIE